MRHGMDRAERRTRTDLVAARRLKSLEGSARQGQLVGWFRKWNLSCSCKMCQINKHERAKVQLVKYERRNSLPEDQVIE